MRVARHGSEKTLLKPFLNAWVHPTPRKNKKPKAPKVRVKKSKREGS